MNRINRRRFLHLSSGVLAGGALLSACGDNTAIVVNSTGVTSGASASLTTAVTSTAAGAATTAASNSGATTAATTSGAATSAATKPISSFGPVTLRWWDQFAPLKDLETGMFNTYNKDNPNVKVEYQVYNPADMGKALQLGFNSKQNPDVHSLAGLDVPPAQLVSSGWFTPIEGLVSADFVKRFAPGSLLEGFHIFGGKLYSFPIFSFRSYSGLLWYNKDMVTGAGVDPASDFTTWDGVRQSASKITKKSSGAAFGVIEGFQLASRLGEHITQMAQRAGAPVGAGGINYKTGEYSFHTDPFLQAVEFFLALQKDGSLNPASTSSDARTGRARFAAGNAGIFLDGPWNIGVIKSSFATFIDKVAVVQLPGPDAKQQNFIHAGPIGGTFFVSSQSKNPAVAANLLERFNTDEYYAGLANNMDQPPLNLSAVDQSQAHPTYKTSLKLFQDIVRLEPSPLVKNPSVTQVQSEMKDIRPNFGEIIQGVLSGTTSDYKTALKDYSAKLTAERDRAIKVVAAKGTKVSTDDWIFPKWDLSKDYTSEFYK